MADPRAKTVSRGFLCVLVAAFLFLGGFAFLVIGIASVSIVRLILAFALLAIGLLFLRAGYVAFGTVEPGPGANDAHPADASARVTSTENGPGDRTQGAGDHDDRMDP